MKQTVSFSILFNDASYALNIVDVYQTENELIVISEYSKNNFCKREDITRHDSITVSTTHDQALEVTHYALCSSVGLSDKLLITEAKECIYIVKSLSDILPLQGPHKKLTAFLPFEQEKSAQTLKALLSMNFAKKMLAGEPFNASRLNLDIQEVIEISKDKMTLCFQHAFSQRFFSKNTPFKAQEFSLQEWCGWYQFLYNIKKTKAGLEYYPLPETFKEFLEAGINYYKNVNPQQPLSSAEFQTRQLVCLAMVVLALRSDVANPQKRTALHFAVGFGFPAVVSRILDNPKTQIDGIDCLGKTALHYAAEQGDLNLVTLLLERGANPLLQTLQDKKTSKQLAIHAGVQHLLGAAEVAYKAKQLPMPIYPWLKVPAPKREQQLYLSQYRYYHRQRRRWIPLPAIPEQDVKGKKAKEETQNTKKNPKMPFG